jgi:hypothetical protein
MAIDYDRMKRVYPKKKAALTRAQNKNPLDRYAAVLAACTAAVKEWDAIGAWPDQWSRWQRALDDAARWPQVAPRLENLER